MTQAWQDRYFDAASGLRLYYRDYPAPPGAARLPVLCLPGLTRNSRDFEDLAPRLQASGRRVLAPDLRGRACSAWDADWHNYHPGTYLDDLERLLADAAVAQVTAVGTSLGGMLSMLIAARRPQQIAAAVINDIGPEVMPVGLARIADYVGRQPAVADWHEAVAKLRALNAGFLADLDAAAWLRFAKRLYSDREGSPRPDYDPGIGDALRAAPTPAADFWPLWTAMAGVPTLVLRGAVSDLLSEATLTRMHREKPDLESVTVPGRGHAPLLDEPDSLAAIDAFIARVP